MNEWNGDGQPDDWISPDLDAAQLADLAAERPDLWNQIIDHPNVYPDLQQWIRENQAAAAAVGEETVVASETEATIVAPLGEETVVAPSFEKTIVAPARETGADFGDTTVAAGYSEETVVSTGGFGSAADGATEADDQAWNAHAEWAAQMPPAPESAPGADVLYEQPQEFGGAPQPDGTYSENLYADAPYADGQYADGQYADAQYVDPSYQDMAPPAPGSGGTVARSAAKKRTLAIVGGCVAGALVLGGGGTALALNDIWPFGPDGLFGSSESKSADDVEEGPSFGAGVQESWSFAADEVTSGGTFDALPRMMTNYLPRTHLPLQVDGAVIFQATGSGDASISVLDSATGEIIWGDTASRTECVLGEGTEEAVCALNYGSQTDLISVSNEGAFDLASVSFETNSLNRSGQDFVLAGPAGVMRVDGKGKEIWASDSSSAQGGATETIQVAGDKVLAVGSNEWRVIGAKGKTLAEGSGVDNTNSNPGDRCDFMLTEKKLLMIGTACDDSVEASGITAEIVSRGDAMQIGLLEDRANKPEAWLHSYESITTAYDAESGEELWSNSGMIPGWFTEPQLVMRDADAAGDDTGDGVLLVDDGLAVVADVETGLLSELFDFESDLDGNLAVVGDTVLFFDTGAEMVTAYDGTTGNEVSVGPATGYENAREATGGRNGALLALPKCDDCSTAEGSSLLNEYVFFGPAAVLPSASKTGGVAAPDFIPACPAKTEMLAWAETDDGWAEVCGTDSDTPSYMAFQLSDGDSVSYSEGSDEPTSKVAKEAVEWDDRLSRYTADLEDGSSATLDYNIGTMTVRNAADTKTLEQKRLVRYLFSPMGDTIRTVQDASDDEGAFSVRAPKDTAEDQTRYMIEVLEKAYDGRSMVKDALPKLENCTAGAGGYADTVATMKAVRDNRAELLESLKAMPVDKIPEGEQLLDDLTEAIRYSHAANVEYVAWAESANANGCASLSSAGQSAAAASDGPKERFAARWNRVVAPAMSVRTFDPWYI